MQSTAIRVLVLLAVLLGALPSPVSAALFPDLPADETLAGPIEDLAVRGVLGGYPDGTFRPAQTVSWGEWTKLVMNVRDAALFSVQAAALSSTIETSRDAAVREGLLPETTPWDQPAVRAEALAFLARALALTPLGANHHPFVDVPAEYSDAIDLLYERGIVRGIDAFHLGPHAMLRQEAAKVLLGALNAPAGGPAVRSSALRLIAMTATTLSPGDCASILFSMDDPTGGTIPGLGASDFRLIVLQGSVAEKSFSALGGGVYQYTVCAKTDGPPGPIRLRIVTTKTATYQALDIPGTGAVEGALVGLTVSSSVLLQGETTSFIAIPRDPTGGAPVSGLTLRASVVAGSGTITVQPVETPAGSGVYVGEFQATGIGPATIRVWIENYATMPSADVSVAQI